MFPLQVTIIGCGGDLLQLLRLELSVQATRIESEYLGVESALASLRSNEPPAAQRNGKGKNEPALPTELPRRLFIVRVDSAQELPSIKRLSSFFPGNP